MQQTRRAMTAQKNIALVAHDNCKATLLDWVAQHRESLSPHTLFATGTTGNLIQERSGLDITCMLSGPMGGDQQLGAMIAEGKIDILIFFWDPLNAVPHDPDVKALLRLAAVWNIPMATNVATADFMVSTAAFQSEFEHSIPDYAQYLVERKR